MTITTKKRTVVLSSGTGKMLTIVNNAIIGTNLYPWSIVESQATTSEGHPFRSRQRKPSRFKKIGKTLVDDLRDTGGNFLSYKMTVFPNQKDLVTYTVGYVAYRYEGKFTAFIGLNPNMGNNLIPVSDGQLDAWGATCIARTIPTSPVAGIGQFLGELRQLPSLPGLALMKARAKKIAYSKAVASEYLNYQFGWVPFAKDLVSLADTVGKADQLIAQYERDSGRVVRRKTVLFDNVTTVVTEMGVNQYGSPPLPTPLYNTPGKLTKTVTTTHRVWFSGAFTYFLAPAKLPAEKGRVNRNISFYRASRDSPESAAMRRRQILSKLYGLRADPYLLYQLYPWSWLADWMTNLGSNIKNLVAFHNDGLVMRYGYIMSYQRETTVYTLSGVSLKNSFSGVVVDVLVKHCKQRRRATPFGFGLNPNAFSARQWSIIAALGISRAPKSLSF